VRSKESYSSKLPGPGELTLISRIRHLAANTSSPELRLGIGDDCALLRPRAGEELAVTTDLSIENRHFRLDWHPPEAIGHRTLARGLSDLAAMGARPVAAFLSLGLPPALTQSKARRPSQPNAQHNSWIDQFLAGLLALAEATKTPLAGGDLAQSPFAVADIVLIGAVPRGRALLRSGAQPGQSLYITGSLGAAAAGLARLAQLAASATSSTPPRIPKALATTLAAHLYPRPRLAQGQWLVRTNLATAALDLSDGLSTDLAHLCQESGVAAEVDADSLPIAPGATLDQALNGGEDYELLFTAPAAARLPRSIAGIPVTRIGRIVKPRSGRPQVTLLAEQRREPLLPRGWEHFS